MLGAFAVGKTSLVRRFVSSIFSEKYHTTIGVKIDKKIIEFQDKKVSLLLWDIHGEDEYQKVQASYLLGSAGYFLVADGTRKDTLDVVYSLQKLAESSMGNKPFILLLNKSDMEDEWEFSDADIAAIENRGWTVLKTSAKTGENVEKAFDELTKAMLR